MARLKHYFPYMYAAGLALAYYWFFVRRTNTMWERGKYTVGYVTGRVAGGKSVSAVTYQCIIDGVTYNGNSNEERGMNEALGTRYPVVYDSLEPSSNTAYFDYPLPASIGNPPVNGWSKKAFDALARADSLQKVSRVPRQD